MYKDQKAGGEGGSAPLPFLEWEAWLGVAVFGLGAGFLVFGFGFGFGFCAWLSVTMGID